MNDRCPRPSSLIHSSASTGPCQRVGGTSGVPKGSGEQRVWPGKKLASAMGRSVLAATTPGRTRRRRWLVTNTTPRTPSIPHRSVPGLSTGSKLRPTARTPARDPRPDPAAWRGGAAATRPPPSGCGLHRPPRGPVTCPPVSCDPSTDCQRPERAVSLVLGRWVILRQAAGRVHITVQGGHDLPRTCRPSSRARHRGPR